MSPLHEILILPSLSPAAMCMPMCTSYESTSVAECAADLWILSTVQFYFELTSRHGVPLQIAVQLEGVCQCGASLRNVKPGPGP